MGGAHRRADEQETARWSLLAVGTVVGIDAGVWKAKTFDRTAVYKVFLDDFFHVALLGKAVPDGFGVDDEDRTVFALVQAP